MPQELASTFTPALKYNRYTQVLAPNGKAIHILAQNELSDEQIIRARNILTHYLTNYPGSRFGSDKGAVANSMADNNAILNLMNGPDDGTNCAADLPGQALFADEALVEGHFWYTQQDCTHRDTAFEEILHLVPDTGIGVDGSNSLNGALPEYQTYIRAAQEEASKHNLWGIGSKLWLWGGYVSKYRNELDVEDPLGANLMPMFFQPYLTCNANAMVLIL